MSMLGLLPRSLRLAALAALAAVLAGLAAQRADAAALIARIAPAAIDPNGPSAYPSLSATGRFIAFGSIASNLGPSVGNSRTPNIYWRDNFTGATLLLSGGLGGPSDDSSTTPSISGDGATIAFSSRAGNLVAGDSNKKADIFVRTVGGPIGLLTRAAGGQLSTGASYQPAISADGRHVAFTSAADDLVFGDENAATDVFVADLATGVTQRVSISSRRRQGNGPSSNPSISAGGEFVSFTSAASNLVPRDRNRVPDVFVRDMRTGAVRRASVSSKGREQNAAVSPPFSQVSDLSSDGRYVVFDSNASNLVRKDRNDHTDIFRHSMVTGRTELVSRRSSGKQADNDSFAPAVSADGNRVVFESSAENLAEPWAAGPNVYVRDISHQRTLIADVALDGGPRSAELDPQLLQQAAISDTGVLVAFESGADNLVGGDDNGANDLFGRFVATYARRQSARVAP